MTTPNLPMFSNISDPTSAGGNDVNYVGRHLFFVDMDIFNNAVISNLSRVSTDDKAVLKSSIRNSMKYRVARTTTPGATVRITKMRKSLSDTMRASFIDQVACRLA